MQKKIIALAVAGLVSGAAFAQSNVTVYGVADMYVGSLKGGDNKATVVNSGGLSGSRLGFKGAEDLGGGVKAVFEMELGSFNMDANANGINGTRSSYVGLSTGGGTVVAGRLQTPGYYVGAFDALASSAISPQAILAKAKMIGGAVQSTIAPSNNGRLDNAVAYLSPDFGGFSGVLAYAAGEQTTGAKQGVYGIGLNYKNGPLAVGYVRHQINNYGGAAAADAVENLFGGSYDLGMVKLLGSYQNAKLDNTASNKLWQVGAVMPVGKGNVHFAYGKLNMDAANADSNSWTLAYTHAMSKRTTLYTGYSRTGNDSGSAMGIIAPSANGLRSTGFVGGVRHTF